MAYIPERVTLGDLSDLLETREGKEWKPHWFGEAHICLSWNKHGHLKIAIPKWDNESFLRKYKTRYGKVLFVPIGSKYNCLTADNLKPKHVFTPHGFLEVVDRTFENHDLYLAHLSFLGYAGFFRYPALKGNLFHVEYTDKNKE